MGNNALPTRIGNIPILSWWNDIKTALCGALFGRNPSSGAPEAGHNLGSAAIPFGIAYLRGMDIENMGEIDFSSISPDMNRITSGATRTTSEQPFFITADGSSNEAIINANTTPLRLSIEGKVAEVSQDISMTGLSLAPSSNNTCTINDTSLTGENYTKYLGEQGTSITIDNAESEITDLIGSIQAYKTGDEIFIGYINSQVNITNCYRGYFFDNAGNPIIRETLSDNDTLTLLKLGWIFVQNNGVNSEASYDTPIYSGSEPSKKITGARIDTAREQNTGLFTGGGKGLTIQFKCKDIFINNLFVDNCDIGFSIEANLLGDKHTENIIINNVIAKNCSRCAALLIGSKKDGIPSTANPSYYHTQYPGTIINNLHAYECATGKIKIPLSLLITLTSCTQRTQVIDTSCIWVKPIYASREDDLTKGTEDKLILHNMKYKEFCGE